MKTPIIRSAWACVEGRSHVAIGSGCEDAGGKARLSRRGAVVALADGAGSAAHAAIGATVAVSSALAVVVANFTTIHTNPGAAILLDPVTAALNAKATELECAVKELATTLLVAAAIQGRDGVKWLVAHMGDGVVAADFGNGPRLFSPPENGEFGNSTYFVTDASAAGHLRIQTGIADAATFVLMTDGAAEPLYRRADQTLAPAIGTFMAWSCELPSRRLTSVLRRNLSEVIRPLTRDDASIAVLRVHPVEG